MALKHPDTLPYQLGDCRMIYRQTAACGCGMVSTRAHFGPHMAGRQGIWPCPACGEPSATPSPEEPYFCSFGHAQEAEDAAPRRAACEPW